MNNNHKPIAFIRQLLIDRPEKEIIEAEQCFMRLLAILLLIAEEELNGQGTSHDEKFESPRGSFELEDSEQRS